MIKINNYSIVHWDDQGRCFICFPDGSGLSLTGRYHLSLVLSSVLYWISKGYKSMFEV